MASTLMHVVYSCDISLAKTLIYEGACMCTCIHPFNLISRSQAGFLPLKTPPGNLMLRLKYCRVCPKYLSFLLWCKWSCTKIFFYFFGRVMGDSHITHQILFRNEERNIQKANMNVRNENLKYQCWININLKDHHGLKATGRLRRVVIHSQLCTGIDYFFKICSWLNRLRREDHHGLCIGTSYLQICSWSRMHVYV